MSRADNASCCTELSILQVIQEWALENLGYIFPPHSPLDHDLSGTSVVQVQSMVIF